MPTAEGLAALAAAPGAWAAAALGVLVVLLWRASAAARRSAAATEPLAQAMSELSRTVESLGQGQHQLAGGLKLITEHQVAQQGRTLETVERRLEEVQRAMGETLHGTATRTARSLGALQERLEAIDRAQANIERLSGDVIGLQDILANKQARGAFGEIQLADLVANALPPDAYTLQATLSTGRRADALIHLPHPPGPIAVDAKFPLEPYSALVTAEDDAARKTAARAFRQAVRVHARAIAERYLIAGETAEGALMFLPSEAVYAELHARFPDLVQESFALRVFPVSPTTLMATLNTMRAILKDARLRAQTDNVRRELAQLGEDLTRLDARVGNLDRHFGQAQRDVEEIKISAQKTGARARRLEALEFEDAGAASEQATDLAPPRVVEGG